MKIGIDKKSDPENKPPYNSPHSASALSQFPPIQGLKGVINGDAFGHSSPSGSKAVADETVPAAFPSGNVLKGTLVKQISASTYAEFSPKVQSVPSFEIFKRSPRILQKVPHDTVEIQYIPGIGSKPEISWLNTLLPSILSVSISIVMAVTLNNPIMMVYTLPMTISGLALSFFTYRKQVKKYNDQVHNREQMYSKYINDITQKLKNLESIQMAALTLSDPPTEDCLSIVLNRHQQLWARRPGDSDFASVRVGNGPIASSVHISIPAEHLTLEEDCLSTRPKEVRDRFQVLSNAPVVCDIFHSQICGIIGDQAHSLPCIKNLIVQLTTHHCYTDLKLICICNNEVRKELDWCKDLPHFYRDDTTAPWIASTKDEADKLFSWFFSVLKQRNLDILSHAHCEETPATLPYYVFFILEPEFLDKSDPINEFLFMRHDLGTGCIIAVQNIAQLPKECTELISLENTNGKILSTSESSVQQHFSLDNFPDKNYIRFGHAMKPLRCNETISKNVLPLSYSFYEMLGVSSIEDFDIRTEWSKSNTYNSLMAPIGVAENGEPAVLDLHEKAHGPHGLVAGMTGSGKSEFLKTYIISMALKYHPYEVSFVIIDFKGGGMASQLDGLPHLIGTITNIDGSGLSRSLLSIESELRRRQKIIKNYNDNHADKVKDIYDYINRYRSRTDLHPLPHLIIIVDEFAELRAEQPEFMKKLISVARIGRSLGVHLILSTQKPAGQVDDQIWSNTNFQVCLKVASPSDSKEVIKLPLAAHIQDLGRAYLRTGNDTPLQLLQSGYSGETVSSSRSSSTQIQETICYIRNYCVANGIEKLPDICLPELCDDIECPLSDEIDGRHFPIGMYDDPENQYQGPCFVDIFSKNVLIIGSSRSGKTNFLQLLIHSLSSHYSPEKVNIYIIDFASMILKSYEQLHHVGGIVTPAEPEKFKNLIKLLYAEIENRKQKFYQAGVSSYAAYSECGNTDLAQIILIIDNFTALRESYLMDIDPLQVITQTGSTYGINVIAANSQTSGISYPYLSNFPVRIALHCNNSAEYHSLFDRCNIHPKDIPGRCIIQQESKLYQCQIYHVFCGNKEGHTSQKIRHFVSSQALKYPALHARPIPVIPSLLPARDLAGSYASQSGDHRLLAAGLDYDTVSPVMIDLKSIGSFAITGKPHFCINNFLHYVVTESSRLYGGRIEFFIIDDIERKLRDLTTLDTVKDYTFLPEQAIQTVLHVGDILSARYKAVLNGSVDLLSSSPLILLIINNQEAIKGICNDSGSLSAYLNIIGKLKNMNVCTILGNVENTSVPYNAPEILKKAKEQQQFFIFDDLENLKIFDLPYALTKNFKTPLVLGDCYFIKGNEIVKLKTPKNS